MKPTYWLLMHKGYGVVVWCELEGDEWALVDRQPERYQIYVLDGEEVKVMVCAEDKTLTRQDALKTASSFVYGRYEKITVDLKRLVGTKEKGEPHGIRNPHPPY